MNSYENATISYECDIERELCRVDDERKKLLITLRNLVNGLNLPFDHAERRAAIAEAKKILSAIGG